MFERVILSPPIEEIRIGSCTWLWMLRVHRLHLDELFRMNIGQRTQQDGVHHAEYGSIGANAQRQRDDGDRSESRILAQLAYGVTDILHDAGQHLKCSYSYL